jgi:predicted RNase H-like HicB family nuclease
LPSVVAGVFSVGLTSEGARRSATMDTYEVELESAEPDGFAAIVPALPGLLVLGQDVDEVLDRVRAAIVFHVGRGSRPVRLAVSGDERGERLQSRRR